MKIYLLAAAIASAFGAGWFVNGWRLDAAHTQFKLELSQAAQAAEQHSLEIERLNVKNASLANEKVSLEKSLQATRNQQIAAEVVEYENSNANSTCVIDDEWVRLHDSSLEALPTAESTAGAHGENRGVPNVGRVLSVVTHNNALCAKAIAQLEGWQDWYPTVRCE